MKQLAEIGFDIDVTGFKPPEVLIDLLVAARRGRHPAAGVSKETRQSPILRAKYERGEHRLDVIELIAIDEALDADPVKVFRQ